MVSRNSINSTGDSQYGRHCRGELTVRIHRRPQFLKEGGRVFFEKNKIESCGFDHANNQLNKTMLSIDLYSLNQNGIEALLSCVDSFFLL